MSQRMIAKKLGLSTATVSKLRARGMPVTDATEYGFKAARAVIERYAAEDIEDTSALWIETPMRHKNTRYFSLRPQGRA